MKVTTASCIVTNITPPSARGVLAEIRKLTRKLVRYVVNTHHHGDHIYGNRVYQEAFPGVDFVGHANMRGAFLFNLNTLRSHARLF